MDYFVLSRVYPGGQLKEQAEAGELDLETPANEVMPAIYMWFKKMSPPARAIANPQQFSLWIKAAMEQTDGIVRGSVGHLGHVQFELGRASIAADKLAALQQTCETMEKRREIQKLLKELDFSIALYVGETSDLTRRINEHLRGATNFATRLTEYGYNWENLGLRFFLVPPQLNVGQRQALERFLASMLLAPSTSRAG